MHFSRTYAIQFYLLLEQLERLKFYFVTYLMVKRHADIHAVNILVKVKQVDFELIAHTINSRPLADIGNAGHVPQLRRAQGSRVHATEWNCRTV